jgi:hypothetical protein
MAGVQWEWTDSERDAIHDLIVFLEPKRVLTVPYELEIMHEVVASLIAIRNQLTQTLQRLYDTAKSAVLVDEMREAVVRFLIVAGREEFVTLRVVAHLGELRGLFVTDIRVLAHTFGLTVRGMLGRALAD